MFQYLNEPVISVLPEDLGEFWRHDTISFVCRRSPALDAGDWLLTAFRGALGYKLKQLETEGFPRADEAWVALFENISGGPVGRHFPKPFTLQYDDFAGWVVFKIILIGGAEIFYQVMMEAGVRALQQGLPLREGGRQRKAYDVDEVVWDRQAFVDVPTTRASLHIIKFLTPLSISIDGKLKGKLDGILMNILNRIDGLARWQDIDLKVDKKAFIKRNEHLVIKDEGLIPVHWQRFSINQPGRPIPMYGFTGKLEIQGRVSAEVSTLLHLAELCHIGGQTAFGYGRNELIEYPR